MADDGGLEAILSGMTRPTEEPKRRAALILSGRHVQDAALGKGVPAASG